MRQVLPWWRFEKDLAIDSRRLVAGCARLLAAAVKLEERELHSTAGLAASEEFARSTKTFSAVLNLASEGFGQQAFALASMLFESCMTVCWASKNPRQADANCQLHVNLGVDILHERAIGTGLDLQGETSAVSEKERHDAELRFGKDGQSLWTGHSSLAELVDEVASGMNNALQARRLRDLWFGYVDWHAQSLTHATGLANRSHRAQNQDELRRERGLLLTIGPSGSHVMHALDLASCAYLAALCSIQESHAPELEGEVRDAYGALWRASKDPKLLEDLLDDDPCPCDEEGTLWGECHGWTQSLGTTEHAPIGSDEFVTSTGQLPDASTTNSTEAASAFPYSQDEPEPEPEPRGPLIYTFACRLPFSLGMQDDGQHEIYLDAEYRDANDIAHFGQSPYVTVRLHNQPIDGFELWPEYANAALEQLYGFRSRPDVTPPLWGEGQGVYEQWVSLETPGARLEHEPEGDTAYAFHRCLHALNVLLRAHDLVTNQRDVRAIATQDLAPIVFRGAFKENREWVDLGILIMHPETLPYSPPIGDSATQSSLLSLAVADITNGRPFLNARQWYSRAVRAAQYRGDYADSIVSMQTSMESMVFDLWRMILFERGKSPREISQIIMSQEGFRSIVTKRLPGLIGGSWDVTQQSRPVGAYWKHVYSIRNRIVHAGYEPQVDEFEAAKNSYERLRDYINERLWQRKGQYPRTLLAKMGEQGLRRNGWLDTTMQAAVEAARNGGPTWPWRWV